MSGGMDLLAIAQSYVDRMVEVPGMKALLLDAETTVSLSGIATQTYIQNHEVFLVEKLEANKTDKLPHLKVRPAGAGPALRPLKLAACACDDHR